MWKAILAGTSAVAIIGSSLVYAQDRPAAPGAAQRQVPTAEDMAAFTDARIAGLKAGLKLTPDQEKNWPALEQAIRDLAKQRIDRVTARRNEPRTTDPMERLRHRADAMATTAAGLKRLADAADPLYKSLDTDQKRRATFLFHRMSGHRFGHWRQASNMGNVH